MGVKTDFGVRALGPTTLRWKPVWCKEGTENSRLAISTMYTVSELGPALAPCLTDTCSQVKNTLAALTNPVCIVTPSMLGHPYLSLSLLHAKVDGRTEGMNEVLRADATTARMISAGKGRVHGSFLTAHAPRGGGSSTGAGPSATTLGQ